MNKPRNKPSLSFEQALHVCANWASIGEKVPECTDSLVRAGIYAFIPAHRYEESYCTESESLEVHQRFVVERAKEILGTPWPLALHVQGNQLVYQSAFLKQLALKRDEENGVPIEKLVERYPEEAAWRHHLDPCLRIEARTMFVDSKSYRARHNALSAEMRARFEQEAVASASGTASKYHFSKDDRLRFLTIVMGDKLQSMGYLLDNRRSRSDFPVYTKQITSDWDICWVFEESKLLFVNELEGRFEPWLELRSRNFLGKTSKDRVNQFLHIRFQKIIPSFEPAYKTFRNLDQLGTAITAHVELYRLIQDNIEEGVMRTLGPTNDVEHR